MTQKEVSIAPEETVEDAAPRQDVEAPDTDITFVEGVPEAPVNSKSLQRKQSVSEAAEESVGRWNAPWFLSWIEYPFHIADPVTGVRLPEVAGQAMDAAARGPLNQTGGYVGSAIVRLAAQDAGCASPFNCSSTVYGIKPSSLLTTTSAITGVMAALFMPVFGAVVDHTRHRKLVGVISGFMAVGAVGAQISISEKTWFFVLCMDVVGGFSLLV